MKDTIEALRTLLEGAPPCKKGYTKQLVKINMLVTARACTTKIKQMMNYGGDRERQREASPSSEGRGRERPKTSSCLGKFSWLILGDDDGHDGAAA